MDAGRLNQRIAIERCTVERDSYGQGIPTWAPLISVWADPVQSGVREYLAGASDSTERKALFRVRYPFPGKIMVTNADRIVWRGETWNVNGVSIIQPLGEAQITATYNEGTDGR